ncbi:hypothetical protein HMI01_28980 [Halolactibacillus miurensis]|uniref:Short C-terminal domain-containing protein n=1 Tax=Halolactibacillus miurensis TaxID=306541 RepID=A0A1I6PB18_9BACI|nr:MULTISPECIES: hypothetical protein [Halolactibacillus]GEM05910.1 hypothetical protein HMI01_28980 [Halolactibacillus miurensis]SFS37353.1 hypothetical protein SAMN05421668_101316 [Halolactibacillus miurensis]
MMFLAIILIGFLLYQYMAPKDTHNRRSMGTINSAREMLDIRLAKGEISVEEYNEIKQAL